MVYRRWATALLDCFRTIKSFLINTTGLLGDHFSYDYLLRDGMDAGLSWVFWVQLLFTGHKEVWRCIIVLRMLDPN
jgi:hypothetical protein